MPRRIMAASRGARAQISGVRNPTGGGCQTPLGAAPAADGAHGERPAGAGPSPEGQGENRYASHHERARHIAGCAPTYCVRTRLRVVAAGGACRRGDHRGVLAGAADSDAMSFARQACAGNRRGARRPTQRSSCAARCAASVNAERRSREASRRCAAAAASAARRPRMRPTWSRTATSRTSAPAGRSPDACAPPAGTATAAEAIGFGCGGLGTPAAVVQSWMGEPAAPRGPARPLPGTALGVGLAVGSPIGDALPGRRHLGARRRLTPGRRSAPPPRRCAAP